VVLKNVGLTGASGMVGRHVLEILKSKNIFCASTSRRLSDSIQKDHKWSIWDLTGWKSPEEMDILFPKAEAILHVGAIVPHASVNASEKDFFDANVRSCLCLGQWALERKIHLVFLSGSTVYAEPEKKGIVESDKKTCGGLSGFYGFTKLLAEKTLKFLEAEGLNLTILRPSSIYGYGLPAGKMISTFLHKASEGQCIELTPPVDDKINLIHAYDVAQALLLVLEKKAYGVFNIAGTFSSSVFEIAQTCVDVVSKGEVKVLHGETSRSPAVRFDLCCDAARDAFAFSPKMNLSQGIKRTWLEMRHN
jgi:UDP-glucose 4-epimerase|tara:strand:+ start:34 stop:951 length:918 start_codon:yes stop_codon:yes gene_type:complete